MGSFAAAIAEAETAPTRDFARHAFEIAALLRVSHTLYNDRVWGPLDVKEVLSR